MQVFQPPFVGWLPRQVRVFSKRILGVITAFTEQWPHSVPFRPGGTTCQIGRAEIQHARAAVDDYANWYARTILGGDLDEWAGITSAEQFHQWIEERQHSLISLYTRYATQAAGLHSLGRGSGNLLSGGLYRQPSSPARPLIPGGVLIGDRRKEFDQRQVREHSRFSWFVDDGPQHPTQVIVKPERHRSESYSWATAPRYGPQDTVMQLGPLAELLLADDPLTTDLAADQGISAYLRQLVRWTRGAATLALMCEWLDELEQALGEPALETRNTKDIDHDADGFGVTNATRGTLMHWVALRAGRISTYQVITPTTWNASPRDSHTVPGHFEQSLVGLPSSETGRGIRSLVLGSHDPCLVCTTQ